MDEVEPSLSALNVADEGLGAAELAGQGRLSEAGLESNIPKKLNQYLVFLTVERLGHGQRLCCAALKLDMLFRYIKIRYLLRRKRETVALSRSSLSSFALAVVAGIGLLGAIGSHAKSEPRPEKPEASRVRSIGKDQPAWYVSVDQGLYAPIHKSGILTFLDATKRHYFYTEPGVYRANWFVDGEQTDWFLVPATKLRDGVEDKPVRGSNGSACSSDFSYYLAVSADTGAVAPYEFTLFEFSCSTGRYSVKGRWDTLLTTAIRGTATVMSQSQAEAKQSQARFQERLVEDERRAHEEQLVPQKRKIGTKLCKQQGLTVFIGFTEAVSPDLDRIQIRVVAATNGPPRYVQDSSFREQVLWDSPVNWSLCDSAE